MIRVPGNVEEMLDMPSGRSGQPIDYRIGATANESHEVRMSPDQVSRVLSVFCEL